MTKSDVTHRVELLSRASALVSGMTDCPAALAALADLLAPELADWCLMDINQDGRLEPRLAAAAHRDPAEVERARSIRERHPPQASAASGVGAIISGAPAELGSGKTVDPLARELGWSSWVIVPIPARGAVVGALTLASSDPARPIGAKEKAIATSVGELAGMAIALARVARERDELLTVVSHDLRNPLGVILLVVDLLRPGGSPEIVGQLGRLERAAHSMSRIINDVVDAARVSTRATPLELESVAATRILEEACGAVQPVADQKGVALEGDAGGVELRGDRARLTRVIEQLIAGAVQRTPPGRKVAVTAEQRGDAVVWSVCDAAPSLPQGNAAGDDEPGRRAGPLSWLIARGIVQAHGGSLWLERGGADGGSNIVRFALPQSGAPKASGPTTAYRQK